MRPRRASGPRWRWRGGRRGRPAAGGRGGVVGRGMRAGTCAHGEDRRDRGWARLFGSSKGVVTAPTRSADGLVLDVHYAGITRRFAPWTRFGSGWVPRSRVMSTRDSAYL